MKALAILLLASALAVPAAAGTTSISITQAARIADGNLVVDLKVGNAGDEAALSVTPILRFGDERVRGKGKPSLGPNTSFDETLSLPVGTLGEGRWPYHLTVDYTDLNEYPFQALHTQALVVGSPPPAKVVVPAIQGGDISGTGALTITVKNLTPEPRTARIHVLVPAEIEAAGGSREVALDPWKDASLEVPLTNRAALVGSRYPVFVTAEYDDGPVHQTVVAQGSVAIRNVGSFVDRWGRWMSLSGSALVLAWLAYLGVRWLGARWLSRRPAQAGSR
jgi:hypothetical protein